MVERNQERREDRSRGGNHERGSEHNGGEVREDKHRGRERESRGVEDKGGDANEDISCRCKMPRRNTLRRRN